MTTNNTNNHNSNNNDNSSGGSSSSSSSSGGGSSSNSSGGSSSSKTPANIPMMPPARAALPSAKARPRKQTKGPFIIVLGNVLDIILDSIR